MQITKRDVVITTTAFVAGAVFGFDHLRKLAIKQINKTTEAELKKLAYEDQCVVLAFMSNVAENLAKKL